MNGDIVRHKPYSITDNGGHSYRVIVEGTCVGWGFSTYEDAADRAYEAVREDRWPFSRVTKEDAR